MKVLLVSKKKNSMIVKYVYISCENIQAIVGVCGLWPTYAYYRALFESLFIRKLVCRSSIIPEACQPRSHFSVSYRLWMTS